HLGHGAARKPGNRQRSSPASRCRPHRLPVASYEALGEAYRTLLQHGVRIERAMDHVNQRSIYFLDPDGNRLEVYFEMPGALARLPEGRGDQNRELTVSGTGEPLPAWLSEQWPAAAAQQGIP